MIQLEGSFISQMHLEYIVQATPGFCPFIGKTYFRIQGMTFGILGLLACVL